MASAAPLSDYEILKLNCWKKTHVNIYIYLGVRNSL